MKSVVVMIHKNIEEYKDCGSNIFLLPLEEFSVSYPITYSISDIKKLVTENRDSEFFVVMNKMIFNDELEELKHILKELDQISLAGIFFYDMALLQIKKTMHLEISFVWNNTHMVTNSRSCNYLLSHQVTSAVISGELEKSEILSLIENTKMRLFYTLLSHPIVAHSRRSLLTNYANTNKVEKKDMLVIHEKVGDQDYLVVEDKNKETSFFSQRIPNHYGILKDLDVPYVILNESYMNHTTFLKILKITNQYLENSLDFSHMIDFIDEILEDNAFFLNQKTVYKVKKEGGK